MNFLHLNGKNLLKICDNLINIFKKNKSYLFLNDIILPNFIFGNLVMVHLPIHHFQIHFIPMRKLAYLK